LEASLKKKEDKHIKYKYLIWKSGEGFVHLDSFSREELITFANDMQRVIKDDQSEEGKDD
tara:strand:- start:285 stop:464 length:180 start_codon:yes stop_codon:yes gene_type:complete